MEGRGFNQGAGTQSCNVEIVTVTADTKRDHSAKDVLKEKVGKVHVSKHSFFKFLYAIINTV